MKMLSPSSLQIYVQDVNYLALLGYGRKALSNNCLSQNRFVRITLISVHIPGPVCPVIPPPLSGLLVLSPR